MREGPSPGSLDNGANGGSTPRARTVSRRMFLRASAAVGALLAALPLALSPLRSLLRGGQPLAAGGRGLVEAHLATLLALADVLLPSVYAGKRPDDHSRARSVVREALERLVADDSESASDLEAAVELLDTRSRAGKGQPFASLALSDRRTLVEGMLEPFRTRGGLRKVYYRVSPNGRGVRRLWYGACLPILSGFYASALGWEVVGYRRAPGVCSNLVDYTGPVEREPA
jgi:hypothetical protein